MAESIIIGSRGVRLRGARCVRALIAASLKAHPEGLNPRSS